MPRTAAIVTARTRLRIGRLSFVPEGSDLCGFFRHVVDESGQGSGGVELDLRPGAIAEGRISLPKVVMGEESSVSILDEDRLTQGLAEVFEASLVVAGGGEEAPQLELTGERQLRMPVPLCERDELTRRVERLAGSSRSFDDPHPEDGGAGLAVRVAEHAVLAERAVERP